MRHFEIAKNSGVASCRGNRRLSKRTAAPFLNGVGRSTDRSEIPPYGLGRDVGRGRGCGVGLTVGPGVIVAVGVAVGVGVRVAVGVAVAVAVAVGVGVGEPPLTAAKMSNRPQPNTLFGGPASPH